MSKQSRKPRPKPKFFSLVDGCTMAPIRVRIWISEDEYAALVRVAEADGGDWKSQMEDVLSNYIWLGLYDRIRELEQEEDKA